ncbi:hypothetical protein FB567DRAFT_532330 [Paraphoma chrysanthemicola]|uniref:Uncharacterized protein n=1 Tax=Paraphoma chrysanthemicola TaxID=798071 RepID=A0A8K0R243_9PLEO|nr:hypothetical protein FB567DRAFT_532330 [Paraphoma chrysanthemicola]
MTHGEHSTGAAQPTTTGASTSAGQTGASTGLGHTEHGQSAGLGDSSRPNVNPTGAGHMHEGMSEASIKSGVIGFGASERQEHAALSSRNADSSLNRDQILGGGNTGTGPTVTDPADQPSTIKQALPLSGSSINDPPHSNTGALGSTTHSSTTQQPFEQSLRKESYAKGTDRSFPLAGGVASKHDPTTNLATEHHATSTTQPTSSQYPQQTSAQTAGIGDREPGTKERAVAAHDGYGREGLAGAAAAAAAVGGASALSHSHQKDVQSQGQETRQATYGDQTAATTTTGATTGSTSQTSHGHHPEALAAATAAAAKYGNSSSTTHGQGVGAQDSSFAQSSRAPETVAPSSQYRDPERPDAGRPPGGRSISYRHVPGGFPTPTPDESKTFLYYKDEVVPEPGADGPILTGEQLKPTHHHEPHGASNTSESSRDPAVASGVAAGVVGATAGGLAAGVPGATAGGVAAGVVGATGGSLAAGHGSTTDSTGPPTTEPHNSGVLNTLDPRVKDSPATQHDSSNISAAPIATGTTTSGPTGQHELRHTGSLEQPRPKSSDLSDDHHYGRDAAIAGGIGAGAAGLGYAATRDRDTAATGSSTLPHEASPYSSHKLDPRVLGDKGKLEEQRYDPQAKTDHTSHHTPQTAAVVGTTSTPGHQVDSADKSTSLEGPVHKSSLLNKLDPRVKDTSSKTSDTTTSPKNDDSQHHLGRDAALVGAGGATAVGARQALQRNDTPGTGTFVLPEQQGSNTVGPTSSSTTTAPQHGTSSAPLSSSATAAPQQSSQTSAPLSSSTTNTSATDSTSKGKGYEAYHGPLTTDGKPFYGTAGAPAPVADSKSHEPLAASSTTAPVAEKSDSQHHYGRDAGLAGAGAAAVGGLAYASQRDNKSDTVPTSGATGPQSSHIASTTTGPHSSNIASTTTGPHSSNIAGTTTGPYSGNVGSTTTGPHQSDTLNRADPRVDEKAGQHHLGRDAAIVGGIGAAGYGAHEAAQAYGDHRSTQPSAAMNDQRYDTTAHGATAANPVPASGHYDYNNDNTSRNVALGSGAALGAGALGGAAYAGSKHADNTQHASTLSSQPLTSSAQPAPVTQAQQTHDTFGQHAHGPGATSTSYPTQGTIAPHNTQATTDPTLTHNRYDSIQEPQKQDHTKRDAALLGGAGAVAAGGAAYGYSQHQDAEREAERLKKEQHAHEKEQHALDKQHAKQEKEAHKLEKEQHKHEKEAHKHDKAVAAAAKDQHKHEKEQEKEAARLEKEREKEAARLEKEREKEVEGEDKKKHGILGFLHRDKSKKEKRSSADSSPRASADYDNKRHSREYAAAGGAAGLGAGTTAAAYAHGRDSSDSNDPSSPRWKGKNKLHKDPPKGHPARDALEHHELGDVSGKREHVGVDGPIGRTDAISGYEGTGSAQPLSSIPHNDVKIEPHTGLPMNVGRYGDGAGGTDANPTVEGHHAVPGGQGGVGAGTDWSDVKKKDTLY